MHCVKKVSFSPYLCKQLFHSPIAEQSSLLPSRFPVFDVFKYALIVHVGIFNHSPLRFLFVFFPSNVIYGKEMFSSSIFLEEACLTFIFYHSLAMLASGDHWWSHTMKLSHFDTLIMTMLYRFDPLSFLSTFLFASHSIFEKSIF